MIELEQKPAVWQGTIHTPEQKPIHFKHNGPGTEVTVLNHGSVISIANVKEVIENLENHFSLKTVEPTAPTEPNDVSMIRARLQLIANNVGLTEVPELGKIEHERKEDGTHQYFSHDPLAAKVHRIWNEAKNNRKLVSDLMQERDQLLESRSKLIAAMPSEARFNFTAYIKTLQEAQGSMHSMNCALAARINFYEQLLRDIYNHLLGPYTGSAEDPSSFICQLKHEASSSEIQIPSMTDIIRELVKAIAQTLKNDKANIQSLKQLNSDLNNMLIAANEKIEALTNQRVI